MPSYTLLPGRKKLNASNEMTVTLQEDKMTVTPAEEGLKYVDKPITVGASQAKISMLWLVLVCQHDRF